MALPMNDAFVILRCNYYTRYFNIKINLIGSKNMVTFSESNQYDVTEAVHYMKQLHYGVD